VERDGCDILLAPTETLGDLREVVDRGLLLSEILRQLLDRLVVVEGRLERRDLGHESVCTLLVGLMRRGSSTSKTHRCELLTKLDFSRGDVPLEGSESGFGQRNLRWIPA
jgi:hypothetical protein